MKYILSLLILVNLFSACQQDSTHTNQAKNSKNVNNSEARELILQSDNLLMDIERKRILTQYTPEEKQALRESLTLIKNALIKVSVNKDPAAGLKTLYTYTKRMQEFQFSLVDESIFAHYLNELSKFVVKTSKKLSVEMQALKWVLFQTNFSEMEPFYSVSSNGDWVNDWALDASFAKIRGSGNKAWLIGPPMDFSKLSKPALKLHHMIMVDSDSSSEIPFDREKIIEETFKIMVSENFVEGDPDNAEWKRVPLSGIPATTNFHSVWSNEMDLSQFKGKNVTVALLYDMNDRKLGRHYVTWQINRFQILGQSEGTFIQERIFPPGDEDFKMIYETDFIEDIEEYVTVKTEENSADFLKRARNGSIYIEVDTFKMKNDGTSYYFSPTIKLSKVNNWIKIHQAVNLFKKSAEYLKLLKIYLAKAEEVDLNLSENWQEMLFEKSPNGGGWNPVESEWLELSPEWKNNEVKIIFQYTSIADEGIFPAWNLLNLKLGERKE